MLDVCCMKHLGFHLGSASFLVICLVVLRGNSQLANELLWGYAWWCQEATHQWQINPQSETLPKWVLLILNPPIKQT